MGANAHDDTELVTGDKPVEPVVTAVEPVVVAIQQTNTPLDTVAQLRQLKQDILNFKDGACTYIDAIIAAVVATQHKG